MTSFSVYLRQKEAEEIRRTAAKRGITPNRLLRLRLKSAVKADQQARLEARLEAVLLLLEALIPEVAYTGGANRAASASLPAAVQKGTETETALRKIVASIRARLEKKAGEVTL
jgi:hypothetical protein